MWLPHVTVCIPDLTYTTTTTIVLWPFVQDYPGEPVPEETLTHPPSWSSSSLYQLLPSTTIHSIFCVQIVCLAIFLQSLSPHPLWSTSWSGAIHLIFHTLLHPISVLTYSGMTICNLSAERLWSLLGTILHCVLCSFLLTTAWLSIASCDPWVWLRKMMMMMMMDCFSNKHDTRRLHRLHVRCVSCHWWSTVCLSLLLPSYLFQ